MFGFFKKKKAESDNVDMNSYSEIFDATHILTDCFFEKITELGVDPNCELDGDLDSKLMFTFGEKVKYRLPQIQTAFESAIMGPMQFYLNQIAARAYGRNKNKAYPGTFVLATTLGYASYLGQSILPKEIMAEVYNIIGEKFEKIGEDLEPIIDEDMASLFN